MAKIGKLPPRKVSANPTTTPFDLMNVTIGGVVVQARPFEISGDPNDPESRPTKLSTSCPNCGHGIYIDVKLGETNITAGCDNCGVGVVPPVVPLEDPFLNPVAEGLIIPADLNSLYGMQTTPQTTAAERIAKRRTKPQTPVNEECVTARQKIAERVENIPSVLDVGEEQDIEE